MLYFLVVYLGIQFGIGYWVSRRIKNENDFLLAGRHVPGWLLSFSLFATWFGAETCIGTSGEVYASGISGGRADPFGYSICLVLLGFLIAGRIWNKKYSTLADFYRDRFGKNVEKLAVAILLISSIVWGAAQIRAFGQVIAATTSLPVQSTILIGFVVVVTYSMLGGLLGDILTDFVQGLILILGLTAILFVIVYQDGFQPFMQSPERLSLFAPGESFWQRLDRWMIPILGSLVAQESIARVLAAKDVKQARQGTFWASGIYIIVGLIPVVLGLIGPAVLPGVEDPEHFLISLSEKYLHPAFQMLLVGALVSAILSTVDSILLAGGGLLSHNLLIPLMGLRAEKRKLLYTRLSVVFIAFVALAIAWMSDGIYELVESASSLGTAGILVITLFGLWTSYGGPVSAIAALVLGVVTMPIAENILEIEAPFIASIALAAIGYVALYQIKNLKLLSFRRN